MLNMTRFEAQIRERGLNVFNVRVLQNGSLVGKVDLAEDIRRLQHSVSKSFTCMAVGLAIEEGKLSLNTTLKDVFPEYAFTHKEACSSMQPGELTLFDLLRMSTGHDSPPFWVEERLALKDVNWIQHYLSLPLDRPPGEQFTYSSGDTIMISAMVQARVGQTVKDYLVPRLFAPLGIENIDWETTPQGITLGCAGLQINTEELSQIGQLLLQKGMWKGQQLIPAAWIDFVTQKQIENNGAGDWGQGYGCQFWLCTHDAYRADGAHGQFCMVAPDAQVVIAINSMEDNMQAILDTVWEEIWPLL
ncbi:serine hydrolase domain-containing protein [Paenibacillus sp. FSL K6-2859]|uniref:serine hydrolase domain-containing protein n=1 Tax=Paenibacillus sp. FSL K6-2859 TaxID=2921482 RepID=UPI0030F9E5E2